MQNRIKWPDGSFQCKNIFLAYFRAFQNLKESISSLIQEEKNQHSKSVLRVGRAGLGWDKVESTTSQNFLLQQKGGWMHPDFFYREIKCKQNKMQKTFQIILKSNDFYIAIANVCSACYIDYTFKVPIQIHVYTCPFASFRSYIGYSLPSLNQVPFTILSILTFCVHLPLELFHEICTISTFI